MKSDRYTADVTYSNKDRRSSSASSRPFGTQQEAILDAFTMLLIPKMTGGCPPNEADHVELVVDRSARGEPFVEFSRWEHFATTMGADGFPIVRRVVKPTPKTRPDKWGRAYSKMARGGR